MLDDHRVWVDSARERQDAVPAAVVAVVVAVVAVVVAVVAVVLQPVMWWAEDCTFYPGRQHFFFLKIRVRGWPFIYRICPQFES
jgi:hypothetical protein